MNNRGPSEQKKQKQEDPVLSKSLEILRQELQRKLPKQEWPIGFNPQTADQFLYAAGNLAVQDNLDYRPTSQLINKLLAELLDKKEPPASIKAIAQAIEGVARLNSMWAIPDLNELDIHHFNALLSRVAAAPNLVTHKTITQMVTVVGWINHWSKEHKRLNLENLQKALIGNESKAEPKEKIEWLLQVAHMLKAMDDGCTEVAMLEQDQEPDPEDPHYKNKIYLSQDNQGKLSAKWFDYVKKEMLSHPIKNDAKLLQLKKTKGLDLKKGINRKNPHFFEITALCGYHDDYRNMFHDWVAKVVNSFVKVDKKGSKGLSEEIKGMNLFQLIHLPYACILLDYHPDKNISTQLYELCKQKILEEEKRLLSKKPVDPHEWQKLQSATQQLVNFYYHIGNRTLQPPAELQRLLVRHEMKPNSQHQEVLDKMNQRLKKLPKNHLLHTGVLKAEDSTLGSDADLTLAITTSNDPLKKWIFDIELDDEIHFEPFGWQRPSDRWRKKILEQSPVLDNKGNQIEVKLCRIRILSKSTVVIVNEILEKLNEDLRELRPQLEALKKQAEQSKQQQDIKEEELEQNETPSSKESLLDSPVSYPIESKSSPNKKEIVQQAFDAINAENPEAATLKKIIQSADFLGTAKQEDKVALQHAALKIKPLEKAMELLTVLLPPAFSKDTVTQQIEDPRTKKFLPTTLMQAVELAAENKSVAIVEKIINAHLNKSQPQSKNSGKKQKKKNAQKVEFNEEWKKALKKAHKLEKDIETEPGKGGAVVAALIKAGVPKLTVSEAIKAPDQEMVGAPDSKPISASKPAFHFSEESKMSNLSEPRHSGWIDELTTAEAQKLEERALNLENEPGRKEDCAQIYFTLGSYYYSHDETFKKAFEFFEKSANNGHARAQNMMGCFYFKGKYVTKDAKEAAKYFSSAATSKISEAQFNLGQFYRLGISFEKDEKKACEYYQLAATQGMANAQNELGICYLNGEGVAKDEEKAFANFQLAATQGLDDAQNNLGRCYAYGTGVAKNRKKAFEYYQLAATQGLAKAQNDLGLCYFNGEGVAKDEKKAFENFQLAAAQGMFEIQYNLGMCYLNGQGVAKDEKKAFENFQSAAAHGIADAQNNLGYCYKNAIGVKKNLEKAFENYRLAATQGMLVARYNLGNCYLNGEGVAKDVEKALENFQLAAAQGMLEAQQKVRELQQPKKPEEELYALLKILGMHALGDNKQNQSSMSISPKAQKRKN
jgi:TPR repeat protein